MPLARPIFSHRPINAISYNYLTKTTFFFIEALFWRKKQGKVINLKT